MSTTLVYTENKSYGLANAEYRVVVDNVDCRRNIHISEIFNVFSYVFMCFHVFLRVRAVYCLQSTLLFQINFSGTKMKSNNTTATKIPRPVGSPPGPRPHTWRAGPDPVTRAQYRAWTQTRTQAEWRGEIWRIDWAQWQAIWQGKWAQRGRTSDSLCITRRDMSLPWSESNVILITRRQHGQRRQDTSRAAGYSRSRVL
jgi:hypothetical protein